MTLNVVEIERLVAKHRSVKERLRREISKMRTSAPKLHERLRLALEAGDLGFVAAELDVLEQMRREWEGA